VTAQVDIMEVILVNLFGVNEIFSPKILSQCPIKVVVSKQALTF